MHPLPLLLRAFPGRVRPGPSGQTMHDRSGHDNNRPWYKWPGSCSWKRCGSWRLLLSESGPIIYAKGEAQIIINMHNNGLTAAQISKLTDKNEEYVKEIIACEEK